MRRLTTRARMESKRAIFLERLAEGRTIASACTAAGVGRTTVYAWREADTVFADAWDAAIEAGDDVIEDEIRRRAIEGVERKVFYQGEHIDTVRDYSDAMLALLAKARMPHRYRERYDVNQTIDVRIDHAAELLAARKRAGLVIDAPSAPEAALAASLSQGLDDARARAGLQQASEGTDDELVDPFD
ncbi:MAG: hypothetical protein IT518_09820 [Burkholderiales bacterium]|nr:hypothetical protein [Burkholderiales bacterium]